MVPDLVEVELDDELEPRLERTRVPRRRWSVRRWAWLATGLAAVLAAVTVVGGVRAASWDPPSQGGLTSDLAVPRHELWSEPDARLVGVVGDRVLVTDGLGSGIRALDVADGTETWRSDGDCMLTPLAGLSPAQVMGRVVVLPEDQGARVVCTDVTLAAQTTRVLDPATGAVLAELAQAYTAIGGYLVDVRTGFAGDGSPVPSAIEVRSATDGTALWSRDLPSTGSTGDWRLTPNALIVLDGSTLRRVDLATGEVRAATDGEVVPLLDVPLADGRTAHTGFRPSGRIAFVVHDADGQQLWSKDSVAAVPAAVRDAAAGEVVLAVSTGSAGGGWAAFDPASGAELWTDSVDTAFPMVHVAGVVVPDGDSGHVRDDRTGDPRWTVGDTEQALPVSDGTTLLLRDRPTGGLVVRDLRSGTEVARYPLPGIGQVAAVTDVLALTEGRLAVVTDTGLTVLAP